jgi:16S rRNA C1402 N4-methylase RsmH
LKLYDSVFYFISGHGRGWAFSSNDLIKKFERQQIDNVLSDLVKEKKIRRVSRGIYDYPKYSELLQKELSPDIEQVARAIGRKFNWRIEVSGQSALNILNLSTQIQAKYIYLSDGPNKSYKLFNDVVIEFKKSVLKDIGFRYKESSLIVQALKSLGKEHITDEIIEKIKEQIEPKMHERILKDTQSTTVWVYEIIKQICKGDIHE